MGRRLEEVVAKEKFPRQVEQHRTPVGLHVHRGQAHVVDKVAPHVAKRPGRAPIGRVGQDRRIARVGAHYHPAPIRVRAVDVHEFVGQADRLLRPRLATVRRVHNVLPVAVDILAHDPGGVRVHCGHIVPVTVVDAGLLRVPRPTPILSPEDDALLAARHVLTTSHRPPVDTIGHGDAPQECELPAQGIVPGAIRRFRGKQRHLLGRKPNLVRKGQPLQVNGGIHRPELPRPIR